MLFKNRLQQRQDKRENMESIKKKGERTEDMQAHLQAIRVSKN